MLRITLIVVACTAFALLGVRDILNHSAWTGAASLMLSAANAILLTR
jgi:hypothetical protein